MEEDMNKGGRGKMMKTVEKLKGRQRWNINKHPGKEQKGVTYKWRRMQTNNMVT